MTYFSKNKRMARLLTPPSSTGTFDGICEYKLWDQFYIRKKSSLTAERVKNAPEFKQTRIFANLLGKASRIGSELYQELSQKQKKKSSYRFITGQVMKILKNGLAEDEIVSTLKKGF